MGHDSIHIIINTSDTYMWHTKFMLYICLLWKYEWLAYSIWIWISSWHAEIHIFEDITMQTHPKRGWITRYFTDKLYKWTLMVHWNRDMTALNTHKLCNFCTNPLKQWIQYSWVFSSRDVTENVILNAQYTYIYLSKFQCIKGWKWI